MDSYIANGRRECGSLVLRRQDGYKGLKLSGRCSNRDSGAGTGARLYLSAVGCGHAVRPRKMALLHLQWADEMDRAERNHGEQAGQDQVYAQCLPGPAHARQSRHGDLRSRRKSEQDGQRLLGGQHAQARVLRWYISVSEKPGVGENIKTVKDFGNPFVRSSDITRRCLHWPVNTQNPEPRQTRLRVAMQWGCIIGIKPTVCARINRFPTQSTFFHSLQFYNSLSLSIIPIIFFHIYNDHLFCPPPCQSHPSEIASCAINEFNWHNSRW